MVAPYEIKVIDRRPDEHNSFQVLPKLEENDLQALQDFYKFDLLYEHGYERAQNGEYFYGIYAIELKAGPAILQPKVFKLDGTNLEGALLWNSWSDADSLAPEVDPRYKETGVHCWTDASGSCGWGFGGESHIGEDGGPFAVWVNSDPATKPNRSVGSDAIDKLGWWDDHIIPNPWYRVMVKGGQGPLPPVTPEYLANVDEYGNETGKIQFIASPPPLGIASLALVRNGERVGYIPWQS